MNVSATKDNELSEYPAASSCHIEACFFFKHFKLEYVTIIK